MKLRLPRLKTIAFLFVLSLLFFLSSSIEITAQERDGQRGQRPGGMPEITIKGKVVDSVRLLPLEYAAISIISLKDSSLVSGGITDQFGIFDIKIKFPRVYLKVEFLGFGTKKLDLPFERGQRLIDLGTIELSPSSEVLEDIEIRAEKSESQFFLDRQVFNVGKDLANRGGTAEDVLDNVPSVTVDIDGVVSLRGNTGVRMLINGKPSGLIGDDNSGLRTISSNLIDRIEVITNPSARYEAEGMAGIINIILKKNTAGGFNGSFDANLGYPIRSGVGANINYRKNNLNWFLNVGLNYNESEGGGFNYQEKIIAEDLFLTYTDRDNTRKSLSNNIRFGADYFLSDKEQITASFLYKNSDQDNFNTTTYFDYFLLNQNELLKLDSDGRSSFLSEDILSEYTTRVDDEIEDEKGLEYSLNYTREFSSKDHKLNALVQFSDRSEIEGSDFTENRFDPEDFLLDQTYQRSNNDEGNKSWLFKADYSHAFSKDHRWEAGLRTSLRDIENDFKVEDLIDDTWVPIASLNNDFIYDEDIFAAYAIYGNSFGDFSFQLGSRLEYADIKTELRASEQNGKNYRDFLNLFPSGHFNYKLNEVNALQISYSKRTRRPHFWHLNPFFTFSDSRNFFSGNPNVNPSYTDSYEISNINYWNNFSLTASLFYRDSESVMQRISFYDNQELSTVTVPLNVGDSQAMGLDLNFSHQGIKNLRLDANFSIYQSELMIHEEMVEDEVNNYFFIIRSFEGTEEELNERFDYELNDTDFLNWNGRLTARYSFWDSDLQLRGNFRAPSESVQGTSKAMFSVDLGWSKDITKKFTMTLSARDIFNSRKRRRTTEFTDFYSDVEYQWRARTINLSMNYRINQKKKRGRPSGENFEGGEVF